MFSSVSSHFSVEYHNNVLDVSVLLLTFCKKCCIPYGFACDAWPINMQYNKALLNIIGKWR